MPLVGIPVFSGVGLDGTGGLVVGGLVVGGFVPPGLNPVEGSADGIG